MVMDPAYGSGGTAYGAATIADFIDTPTEIAELATALDELPADSRVGYGGAVSDFNGLKVDASTARIFVDDTETVHCSAAGMRVQPAGVSAAADLSLHVVASNPSGAAFASTDIVGLDRNGEGYINIRSPSTGQAGLILSDGTRQRGFFVYNHNTDEALIGAAGSTVVRVGTNVLIGSATDLGGKLQIEASDTHIELRNASGDATNKLGMVTGTHYNIAEEVVGAIYTYSTSAASTVGIGGGWSATNAATQISMFAAATNKVTTGTEIVRVTTAGMRVEDGVSGAPGFLFHVSGAGDVDVMTVTNNGATNLEAPGGGVLTVTTTGTSGLADVKFVDQDSASGRATLQIQGNAGATETAFFGANGNVLIGSTTDLGATLQVEAAGPHIELRNSSADTTAKAGAICTTHYTVANAPLLVTSSICNSSTAQLYIGGSTSASYYEHTDIIFWAAANNTGSGKQAIMHIQDGGVQIAQGAVAHDASCILELNSTTQSFCPPVMTTTQRDAISTPKTGSLIWNSTTGQLEDYNGSAWGAV